MPVSAMASSKPSARSLAGADPVVPSSTTIFVAVSPKVSAAHSPAMTPSFLKSRPTQLAKRSSDDVTVRSSRTTGMPASDASCSTSSQPSSTIGAMTIASTPWLMKSRTAAICAAVSLSAALNVSSKPFSAEKAVFIDSVFALRQPDSEPVCAKPTVMGPSSPASPPSPLEPAHPVATSANAASRAPPARNFFFMFTKPPRSGPAPLPVLISTGLCPCRD